MKTAILTTIAALLSTAATAGPFGLPDHEQNGYRDTGCDPTQQVQIVGKAGNALYSNNPTCPSVSPNNTPVEEDEEAEGPSEETKA